MSYILDPISIATDGYIGPVEAVDLFCPAPIAIAIPYVRFELLVGDGVNPQGAGPQANRRILRDDDDIAILLTHAFMEMRNRWR